jgi:4-hydroxyphenylacetate 3-monooxygenase
MGARSGAEYLRALRDGREIWLDGQRVEDVTEDPRLGRAARSIAALYDLQSRADLRERMTFASPATGDGVGMAFLPPKSSQDLVRRREAFKVWADYGCGMVGRAPDFLSAILTGFASAHEFFAQGGKAYSENILRYHTEARENDWCLTHALSKPVSASAEPLCVVDENDRGIVVTGARTLATLAPFSDEIVVFPGPSPGQFRKEDAARYAFAFCLPVATPGLRFICRESLDAGRPVADHPLASRFDEEDAVAVFDRVQVPYERLFLQGDSDLGNALWRDTQAYNHGMHQFMVKNLAKAEFVLGVTALVAESGGAARHLHVQSMLGEIVDAAETVRAFLRAAEADAVPGPSGTVLPNPETLDTARNYFPVVYPRLIEILQLIGASGHITHVSDAMASGEMTEVIEKYYGAGELSGRERNKLLKLAWDTACSAFAGRQVLYERYFDGDVFRRRGVRYTDYVRKAEVCARVQAFLARD